MQQATKISFLKREESKPQAWTACEDDKLIHFAELYNGKWKLVAAQFQDRNEKQCLHRFRRLNQVISKKRQWTRKDDQKIIQLVRTYGNKWNKIAKKLRRRTGKQIRQRYLNILDPTIRKDNWSEEQDRELIRLYNKVGSKWSVISRLIAGRPQNSIKNRFYSHIQRYYSVQPSQNQIQQDQLSQVSKEVKEQLCEPSLDEHQTFSYLRGYPLLLEAFAVQECVQGRAEGACLQTMMGPMLIRPIDFYSPPVFFSI